MEKTPILLGKEGFGQEAKTDGGVFFLKEIEKFYGTKEKNRQGEDLETFSGAL